MMCQFVVGSKFSLFTIFDEVWISSVKRAQLPPIPLVVVATFPCMVTGVVPATTPPTLKLGIRKCNVLKENSVKCLFLTEYSTSVFLSLQWLHRGGLIC